MSLTIGVDIGGTKVAAGVVDERGTLLAEERRATPARDPDAVVGTIVAAIARLQEHHEVEAVGLAAPGFVDEIRSLVRIAPNIPGWRDRRLRSEVESQVGVPVVVENDANAAAWAECRYGAGRVENDLVMVTVGTGIGGGIINDGRLYRGRFGSAAEVGHMKVLSGGRPCGCGQRGCWEQYASGQALVREARDRAAADRVRAHRLLALGDGTPEGIEGKHVTEAAKAGDQVAVEAFGAVGEWLGVGLADLGAVLDPGLFVIGGGVSEAGGLLLEPARQGFAQNLSGHDLRPVAEIRIATLGNDAGMVGAADLARRR
ncbi:MAG: ROK family glucokinase [Actinomycetes bacterium]